MIFGIAMLLVIYLLYVLFVQGALWKLILFFGGWFGIYAALRIYVDGANDIIITVSGYGFSWAETVPTAICILALLTTEVKS